MSTITNQISTKPPYFPRLLSQKLAKTRVVTLQFRRSLQYLPPKGHLFGPENLFVPFRRLAGPREQPVPELRSAPLLSHLRNHSLVGAEAWWRENLPHSILREPGPRRSCKPARAASTPLARTRPSSLVDGMTASVGMAQAAAGALAFVITDAAMPQWEWSGVDLSATLLNISGVCDPLSYCCTATARHVCPLPVHRRRDVPENPGRFEVTKHQ